MTQEILDSNKNYAIIELGIDSSKLTYFQDDNPEIWEKSDVYTFKAKKDMTDEEYQEYIFTVSDLTKHYDGVLVCSRHAIIKFTEDVYKAEILDSVAFRGTSVRYGAEQTKIIFNNLKEPYKSPYEDDDYNYEEEYEESNNC